MKCKVKTREYSPIAYIVKGVTEVRNPSEGHYDVPYYVLLLEDENKRLSLRKSFNIFEIGNKFDESLNKIHLPQIGIVGTGVTAVGIAQIALMSGCNVILKGRSISSLDNAMNRIRSALSKHVIRKKELDVMLSSIKPTQNMSDLASVDIVIEAVIEDINVKRDVFKDLEAVCSENTVLATNTSSLSIDEISGILNHPERVIGMHFFNPVSKMRLVEIVCGAKTDQRAIEYTRQTARSLQKTPVIVKNSPAFIVNRLLMTFLNEAVQILEDELATKEDIDNAVELGLKHPIGPFKLLDLIGIDVFNKIMDTLHEAMPNKYKLSALLEEMESEALLGRKTGKGFYTYS
ncbi:MAG: 3-hydroxyacyl-CoA dehydrogenase family protein [Nitrospirae bacterium]|nr:3-hydroxyacyl-CoA dehydrogenase family protein [Nitrospirota bacterium]